MAMHAYHDSHETRAPSAPQAGWVAGQSPWLLGSSRYTSDLPLAAGLADRRLLKRTKPCFNSIPAVEDLSADHSAGRADAEGMPAVDSAFAAAEFLGELIPVDIAFQQCFAWCRHVSISCVPVTLHVNGQEDRSR